MRQWWIYCFFFQLFLADYLYNRYIMYIVLYFYSWMCEHWTVYEYIIIIECDSSDWWSFQMLHAPLTNIPYTNIPNVGTSRAYIKRSWIKNDKIWPRKKWPKSTGIIYSFMNVFFFNNKYNHNKNMYWNVLCQRSSK